MTNLLRWLPSPVQTEIETCGLPYEIRYGKKHIHIMIDGHLAAIFPINGGSRDVGKGTLNIRACIRRKVRERLAARVDKHPTI